MAPTTRPYDQPQCAQSRPYYVPSPPVSEIRSRPERGSRSALQNGSASPSMLPAGGSQRRTTSISAASRLHTASPSAYRRFDEISWIVDLTSRIGSALQTPSQPSGGTLTNASPSPSSSQAQIRARNRVRIPRPSKEFRELQQKVQGTHASTSALADSSIGSDSAAQTRADDSVSSIQWVQHAQEDFERRRVDLERSRRGTFNSLEPDLGGEEEKGETVGPRDLEPGASGSVDPAVERSLLAAKSLQELMRNGGLQSEDGDDQQPGFADLLANAEPLPGASAELGPSSLFEANRGADGTLDIESVLQQRARIAGLNAHDQGGSTRPKPSMVDLSQSGTVKPGKKPVIEVLGADGPASAPDTPSQLLGNNQGVPTDAANKVTSQISSSESSSESEDSDDMQESGSDSDAAADDLRERSANAMVHSTPQPMDQIAIVDGTFRIVPAQSHSATSQQSVAPQRYEIADGSSIGKDDSDQEEPDDHDSEDEQMENGFGSEASDASAEDDEDNELDESAEDNGYQDGYPSTSSRDLLFEGPTGDADEPIVLSDSDEDDESADEKSRGVNEEEEEIDEGVQDELVGEFDDEARSDIQTQNDAGESDTDDSMQQMQESWHSRTNRPEEDEEQGEAGCEPPGVDMETDQAAAKQSGDVPFNGTAAITRPSHFVDDNLSKQQGAESTPIAIQREATPLQSFPSPQEDTELQFRNFIDHESRDAMPDSEVEPDDFDEDLRWTDIEAAQSAGSDSSYPQNRINAEADTALQAMQASQPMPGFVTASQLFADAKAVGSTAGAQAGSSATTGDHSALQIDPQLLAAFTATQQTPELLRSNGSTSASVLEEGPSGAEQTANHTETDIFEAFMRPSASLAAREATVEDEADRRLSSPVHLEEQERGAEGIGVLNNTAPDLPMALSGTAVGDGAPIASKEVLERRGWFDSEAPIGNVQKDPGSGSLGPAKAEHEDEADENLQASDTDLDTVSRGAHAEEKLDESNTKSSQAERQQEEPRTASSGPDSPVADSAEDRQKPAEAVRQDLTRDKSSDMLEAEVGDSSEEGTGDEAITIRSRTAGSGPTLHVVPPSSHVHSEASGVQADHNGGMALNDAAAAVEHFVAGGESVDTMDKVGRLSGDFAGQEGSVRRQALTRYTTAPEAALKSEGNVIDARLATERFDKLELGSSSSIPAKRKEVDSRSVNDEKLSAKAEKDKLHSEEDPTMDQGALKRAKLEEEPDNAKLGQPTPSNSGRQRSPLEGQGSTGLSNPSLNRVPPSPASSDRRSVASFTPSANRHGHRHLHGAVKRNLLAQMTEAATNFASNLAAPLRAIPSLLPIRESSANEAEEDDEPTEAAAALGPAAKDEDQTEARSQQAQTKKPEPVEFTMKTRSHCYYRQLELSNVEGVPVFIVPGCAIDYIHAEEEQAHDLGPTTEQDSENWIDVNPDFLPLDVHHTLSRIIGLDMLNEGIFAEPESSAAKLLLAGYNIDEGLPMSSNEQEHEHDLAELGSETDVTGEAAVGTLNKEEAVLDTAPEEKSAKDASVNIGAAVGAVEEEPETPSRVTRQSSRRRRADSAASSSSHHRSPRRSDPMSANADYLPDRERQLLHRDRHPSTLTPGDLSIASIEEQLRAGEDEDVDPDERFLQGTGDTKADGGHGIKDKHTAAAVSVSSPQPKRKRGRPKKSADIEPENKSSTHAEEINEDLTGPSKSKTSRGRKDAVLPAEVSGEHQAVNAKGAANGADVSEAVVPKPKRARRARKSEQTAASDPSQQDQEEERIINERQEKDEDATLQQSDEHEPQEGGSLEARSKGNAQRRGSRARNLRKATEESANTAEAAAAETASNTSQNAGATQPRRSRRSEGISQTQSTTPSKTSPRKASKRNVLKLN